MGGAGGWSVPACAGWLAGEAVVEDTGKAGVEWRIWKMEQKRSRANPALAGWGLWCRIWATSCSALLIIQKNFEVIVL